MSDSKNGVLQASSSALRLYVRPFSANRSKTHPIFVLCAVGAMLIPAHPSLQTLFLSNGIPAPAVSGALFIPLVYVLVCKRPISNHALAVLSPFIAYIVWLLVASIASPALGQPNQMATLRGVLLLTPIALVCALIAVKDEKHATRAIFILGFAAVVHYCVIFLSGGQFEEAAAFRSLSGGTEIANYQATSFYFGLVAVGMASVAVHAKSLIATVLGILGLVIVLAIMGTVGARAPMVAVVISFFVITIFSGLRRAAKTIATLVFVGLVAILVSWRFDLIDFDKIKTFLLVVERFSALAEAHDSSSRVRLFSSAIEMWISTPMNFLLGGGIGAFPGFIGETSEGWYPHNFVLESLAEAGGVAGLFLLAIAVKVVQKLADLKTGIVSFEQVYLSALAVYSIVAYQFMGGLQSIWIPIFFVGLLLLMHRRRSL